MKRFVCLVLLTISCATAQDHDPDRLPMLPELRDISVGLGEPLPTGFLGVGARAVGMGGAQIAGVADGTALYWNPGALTRVKRLEISASIGHLSPQHRASVSGGPEIAASQSWTSLNSLAITIPYPVYRGGLSIALGVFRPQDFGYRTEQSGTTSAGGRTWSMNDDIRQEGGMRTWSMGLAFEASGQVAVGFALNWHHGNTDVRRSLILLEQGSVVPDSFAGSYAQKTDITGFSISYGTTVRLPLGISLGAKVVPPTTYTHKGTWGDEYVEAVGPNIYDYDKITSDLKYKLKTPWQFGVGAAWNTFALTVEADVWYVDWTQARYEDTGRYPPFAPSSGIDIGQFFEDRYESSVRGHFGVEFLVPRIDTYIRAGYTRNADPFKGPALDSGFSVDYEGKGNFFSVGVGRMFGGTMQIDAAYVRGGDTYSSGGLIDDRITNTLLVSVAYRL